MYFKLKAYATLTIFDYVSAAQVEGVNRNIDIPTRILHERPRIPF